MAEVMKIHTSPSGDQIATKAIVIDAPISKVWKALTIPELMKDWMSDTEIHISTDWKVGSPITIDGHLHRIKFENKGTVLRFEPERILQYSHLSSLSRLANEPKNYSIFEFALTPVENQTNLALTLINFPTEAILKHLVFYWNVSLEVLKRRIENNEF